MTSTSFPPVDSVTRATRLNGADEVQEASDTLVAVRLNQVREDKVLVGLDEIVKRSNKFRASVSGLMAPDPERS